MLLLHVDIDISPTSTREEDLRVQMCSCTPVDLCYSRLSGREMAEKFSSSFTFDSFDGFGILAWQLWSFRVKSLYVNWYLALVVFNILFLFCILRASL